MSKDIAGQLRDLNIDASRISDIVNMYPEDLTLVVDRDAPLWDPRVELPVEPELLEHIMTRGVQNAVIARRVEVDGKEIVQLLIGRRRTVTARRANELFLEQGKEKRKIPVRIGKFSDKEAILLAIGENDHRLPESIYSKAIKVRNAINAGATHAELRKEMKCSPNTIQELLAYLDLDPSVREAFDNDEFKIGSIKAVASLPKEEQKEVIEEVRESGDTTNRAVQEVVQAKKEGRRPRLDLSAKKMTHRPKIESFVRVLQLPAFKAVKECEVASALLQCLLGNKDALKKYPELESAAETAGIPID